MEPVKLAFIGFVLGITSVIPGISVATMAVVFNIYDRLINIIVPNVKKILAEWIFWLPLIVGGICGILFASKVITLLFANFSVPTYWFFIGVIAGSIPVVYSRTREPSSLLPSLRSVICTIAAVVLMIVMAVLKPGDTAALYTEFTLPVFGMLALAGALGAIAMIVPGISGAFVLLVIGLYGTILRAVSEFNISFLIPVILGAVAGLLAGAALVRFLLLKAPRETYGAVLGLVAGSVLILYPGGFGEGLNLIISVLCLLVGFALSYIMSIMQPFHSNESFPHRKNKSI